MMKRSEGFSLIETLLAVAFLGIMAIGVSSVYSSGLRAMDGRADMMLLDGKLRSRMEVLISTNFTSLNNGSEVVTINGKNYTIAWTVATIDLSGDSVPEPQARQVIVSVTGRPERSLTTILVDNEGKVGRIS